MINRPLTAQKDPAGGFADIHTHILPGADDGAQDISQALALVRMAHENGTRAIFLTPHYRGQFRQKDPAGLQERFSALCHAVAQEMPDMKLYLGQEIYFEQEAPERLAAQQILSMNGSRYCLIEFGAKSMRSQIVRGVSEMRGCGFIPIIAHAERYDVFRRDESLTDEVLDMGALIQLNADSVLNKQGWAVSRFCKHLLKARKAHFIATDAHDAHKRPPLLRGCWKRVCREYGTEYAAELFYENARSVAENKEL